MADSGAERAARHRAHVAGDHSKCRPESCPDSQVKADDAARARRYRKRHRLHGEGDHSMCLPGKCEALEGRDATIAAGGDNDPAATLAARGRALWGSVTAASELSPLHRELLVEACRIADRLERLDRQLHGGDWLRFRRSPDDPGEITMHVDRALSEAREQENTLKALVLELAKVIAQKAPEKKGGGALAAIADELAAKRRKNSAG